MKDTQNIKNFIKNLQNASSYKISQQEGGKSEVLNVKVYKYV